MLGTDFRKEHDNSLRLIKDARPYYKLYNKKVAGPVQPTLDMFIIKKTFYSQSS